MHTSSESHSVECRYPTILCIDLATTPGCVPGHDPLRLPCDSGISAKDIRGALVMSLDSLAGWSSAQRARSPSAALRCRPRGSSRLGDFKSFSVGHLLGGPTDTGSTDTQGPRDGNAGKKSSRSRMRGLLDWRKPRSRGRMPGSRQANGNKAPAAAGRAAGRKWDCEFLAVQPALWHVERLSGLRDVSRGIG